MSTSTDLDRFAAYLRDLGERLPVEPAPLPEHQDAGGRRRGWIPGAAAAAVIGVAIAAGVVATNQGGEGPTAFDGSLSTVTTRPGSATTTPSTTPSSTRPTELEGTSIGLVAGTASVAEPETPELIDVERSDVSASFPIDGLAPFVEGANTFGRWMVEWQGGFLLGLSDMGLIGPEHFEAQMSPDGRTWEPIEISFPPIPDGQVQMASTSDRLVAAGTLRDAGGDGADVVRVAWTSDLQNWSSFDVPVTEPSEGFPADTVHGGSQPVNLVANETGWAIDIRQEVDLDIETIADDLGLTLGGSWGSRQSYGHVVLRFDGPDGNEESVEIDLAEDLGLSPEQSLQVHLGGTDDVWFGSWDGAVTQLDDLPPGWHLGLRAFDGGIASWTTTHVGVLLNGAEDMTSYSLPESLQERFQITTVLSDGADIVVMANDAATSELSIQRFDVDAERWVPLDTDFLPRTLLPATHDVWDVVATSTRIFAPDESAVSQIDVGDLRYTQTDASPISSYSVERISTGEQLVTESQDARLYGDWRTPHDEFRQRRGESIVIIDPSSGEPLLEISGDDLLQLYESATPAAGDFVPAESWIAAPLNGGWVADEVGENTSRAFPPPGLIVRTENSILAQTEDGWILIEAR